MVASASASRRMRSVECCSVLEIIYLRACVVLEPSPESAATHSSSTEGTHRFRREGDDYLRRLDCGGSQGAMFERGCKIARAGLGELGR